MYRQYYCGCVFSKRERDAQIAAKAAAECINSCIKNTTGTCGEKTLHVEWKIIYVRKVRI